MSTIEEQLQAILEMKTIAVVGLSPNPARTSHGVSHYMQASGYTIIPVNPGQDTIMGLTAYARLADIPGPVDIVNVFRRPEYTPEVAAEAVAIGARALWLQLGIHNAEALRIALDGGLLAVEDRCIKVEHGRLMGRGQIQTPE